MKYWPLIAVMLAVGCASHEPVANIPPAHKASYVIPFTTDQWNMVMISAAVNTDPGNPKSQPVAMRLNVDTGSAHTAYFVSEDEVNDLLATVPHATMDAGLAANATVVWVCHFHSGRITIGNLSVDMPVDASGREVAIGEGCDGVLGTDFLSRFKFQIDYQAKTMTLTER